MNRFNTRGLAFSAAILSLCAYAAPASAQATRTWVSGVGDDVNPCSRTAPCKTFAGAISKTAAGGEINCLDPGGFGAVTITKSLTIDCHYTEGGALAGGNGVVVNLPAATDVVLLRGLDLFGVNPPSNGVRFIGLGSLYIEDCVIRRFNAANSLGVSVSPTGAANLYISNSLIADNGDAASGGGIQIQPGVGGSVRAVLRNTRVDHNLNNALRADSTNGAVTIVIENSSFTEGAFGLNLVGVGGALNAMVNESLVAHNTNGIFASGASARARVGNTTITNNNTGVSVAAGGTINTYNNNRLDGNGVDGVFTQPPLPPH
jgi:hypothetical protein